MTEPGRYRPDAISIGAIPAWFRHITVCLLGCFSCCPGPWFNIKMSSYQYRKSHCEDKTILRPSYLHKGISYTGKTTSLYWIRVQVFIPKQSILNSRQPNNVAGFTSSLTNHPSCQREAPHSFPRGESAIQTVTISLGSPCYGNYGDMTRDDSLFIGRDLWHLPMKKDGGQSHEYEANYYPGAHFGNTLKPAQITGILCTTYSNVFSWRKLVWLWLEFYWSWFQLPISHHWYW